MADRGQSEERGRPSPDALLAALATGEDAQSGHNAQNAKPRGRLKVFFGAAPGVGKTYEMLQNARERSASGIDLVVGVVETHGRAETAKLLEGFEIIPKRLLEYKGTELAEMDLDAILARRPQLVLVDELAHTNAVGSRHPKRYLDVLEILDSGIDVYTTLNVQHVESLNDVVAQITRIRVRETVPDSILDRADQIEVIDATPETLTERLRDGKIYVREQAQRALKHYFSPGNLTALRELALRRTAQRVDDQMLDFMRSHAIQGPWAAGDQVLVCVGEDERSAELIRYARRVADRLHAPWTAVYVETDRHERLNEAQRNAIAENLRLAEKLGGRSITLSARRIADAVIDYARTNNFTHIVIGKSARSRLFELIKGSVVHDLVRGAGSISVHVIAGQDASGLGSAASQGAAQGLPMAGGAPVSPAARLQSTAPAKAGGLLPYLASAGVTALATAVSVFLGQALPLQNMSLVFLAAVLFSAVRYGLWPSTFSAVLSAAAYNFFFLPPLYTFSVADPANVVSLLFFIVVAFITSNLASKLQRHTRLTARRALLTEEMYAFSRKLAGIGSLDELLWSAVYQMASMAECQVVILLPKGPRLEVSAAYPPEDTLGEADLAAAHWSWKNNHPTGRGSDTLPGAPRLFLPLQTRRGCLGVAGILRDNQMSPAERRLIDALLDQAAVGIERITLAADVDRARLQAETERLRNALLTSISHDLRTPLSTIIGGLTSLRSFGDGFDAATRDELLSSALDEAERLNRFVSNLLDMTKLEAGGLAPKHEPVDIADVVGSAITRVGRLLTDHKVEIDLTQDGALVSGDFVLLEQVLINLIDNAAKYAAPDTAIRVSARTQGSTVILKVEDEGPGIPQEALEAIFDKFTRLKAGDRQRAGTGLGLQICRGFVTAMGGTISATNRAEGKGAVFTITLPAAAAEPRLPPDETAPMAPVAQHVPGRDLAEASHGRP